MNSKTNPETIDLTSFVNEAMIEFLKLSILDLKRLNPELKDLEYLKQIVSVEGGGRYLLTLMHIDGPKIELTKSGSRELI